MLALILVSSMTLSTIEGLRLQAQVAAASAWSTRGGTRAAETDWLIGGDLQMAPVWGFARLWCPTEACGAAPVVGNGLDFVALRIGVRAGSLGAKASDSTPIVSVSSTDVRVFAHVFAYYPIYFLDWLGVRLGPTFGFDISIRPTTTIVSGQRTAFTSYGPGVGYGARMEVALWHFYVAFDGGGSTTVTAGQGHTLSWLGGAIGGHFEMPFATPRSE